MAVVSTPIPKTKNESIISGISIEMIWRPVKIELPSFLSKIFVNMSVHLSVGFPVEPTLRCNAPRKYNLRPARPFSRAIRKKESCEAGFSACGGSRKRHSSIPLQCDPRGAFLIVWKRSFLYDKKECALAHSRAEARLLRQPSTLVPSAHPRGAFLFHRMHFPMR